MFVFPKEHKFATQRRKDVIQDAKKKFFKKKLKTRSFNVASLR